MKFLRTHGRDYGTHRDLKTDGQMEPSNILLLLLLLVTVAAVVVMVVLVAVVVLEAVVGISG